MTLTAPISINKSANRTGQSNTDQSRTDQNRNEVRYMSSTAAELNPRSHGPIRIAENLGIALVNWSRKQDPAFNAEGKGAHSKNLRLRESEAARIEREVEALRRMQRFGV